MKTEVTQVITEPPVLKWRRPVAWKRLAKEALRYPIVPLSILGVVAIAGVFAPLLAPHDPSAFELRRSMMPPAWDPKGSSEFLLGTDKLGRDILSRIIWGARISLTIGFLGVGFAGAVGTTLGLVAGYFGGKTDAIIMRIVDIKQSIPAFLLALVLAAVIGPSLQTIIMVVMLAYWTGYARLIRGETLSVKQRDYVALARVAGCSPPRILFKHILPNIINTAVVLATLQLGSVIIFEASLSFLGLGVQPPASAWGSMLADGRSYLTSAWWLSVFPGLAIMFTVLGCNLTGDWLRDFLDPKRRQV